MARLPVPIIVTVTGEGRLRRRASHCCRRPRQYPRKRLLFRNLTGRCASIIWRDSTKAETAAIRHEDHVHGSKELGIVDEIIAEPDGGAHSDHDAPQRFLATRSSASSSFLSNQGIKETPPRPLPKVPPHVQFFDLGG